MTSMDPTTREMSDHIRGLRSDLDGVQGALRNRAALGACRIFNGGGQWLTSGGPVWFDRCAWQYAGQDMWAPGQARLTIPRPGLWRVTWQVYLDVQTTLVSELKAVGGAALQTGTGNPDPTQAGWGPMSFGSGSILCTSAPMTLEVAASYTRAGPLAVRSGNNSTFLEAVEQQQYPEVYPIVSQRPQPRPFDEATRQKHREHWHRFRQQLHEEGGKLDEPDHDVPGLNPVRRLLTGPAPPEKPKGGWSRPALPLPPEEPESQP